MSTKTPGSRDNRRTKPKLRHESGPGLKLADAALFVIFIVSLFLIPAALFAMAEERGPIASIKFLLVGFAAAGAAYAVNKFAVDRLAPLHAIGYKSAGLLAVCGILLTGSGTALGSFTGITFGAVEAKVYQLAGKELAAFIGTANRIALVTGQVEPAVEGIAGNIDDTATCEIANSCLSNIGTGGRGPMSRELEAAAAQAYGILDALIEGSRERKALLEQLNHLNDQYNTTLGDQARSLSERRAELQSVHAEVGQVATALTQAMPLAVLQSYASDLQQGATISGDPSGTRKLNAFLREHGDALAAQLDSLPERSLEVPEFPDRPGMLEVLKFLPAFLGIAAIVIVGELILPITLYFMTYFRRAWQLEVMDEERKPEPKDDGFDGLIDFSSDDDGPKPGPTA